MSIAIRKYNILKRLLFNIKREQDIILTELVELGIDISTLDDDDQISMKCSLPWLSVSLWLQEAS